MYLFFGSGKQVSMPNWWGNKEVSVERRFALDSWGIESAEDDEELVSKSLTMISYETVQRLGLSFE